MARRLNYLLGVTRGVPHLMGLVMLLATLQTVPAAQTESLEAQRQAPQTTFRAGVEVVTVGAAVQDRRGRIVRDLPRAEFEVFDSGIRREIRDFYAGDAPISLAVLLDISGSMNVSGNIDRARDAVRFALTNLQSPRDESAFFTFDTKLRQVVGFTTDLTWIDRLNLEGKPFGMTSLHDAIAETARVVAARPSRHRAVFVITDGVDTGSRLSPTDVSGIASSIDVPVYLLAVVNPADHPGGEYEAFSADGASASAGSLADLARWTGGDMRVSSVPAHTREAVHELFAQLRHQYLITFEPDARLGWHPIEVRLRNKNLTVRARGGYISGPAVVNQE
jgi:Ca-activated chloride channel family protein